MNEFDDAARRAAKELADGTADPLTYEEMYCDVITKHFADIRASYEKLVELANTCETIREAAYLLQNGYETSHAVCTKFSQGINKTNALVADPLVARAIERSK